MIQKRKKIEESRENSHKPETLNRNIKEEEIISRINETMKIIANKALSTSIELLLANS